MVEDILTPQIEQTDTDYCYFQQIKAIYELYNTSNIEILRTKGLGRLIS